MIDDGRVDPKKSGLSNRRSEVGPRIHEVRQQAPGIEPPPSQDTGVGQPVSNINVWLMEGQTGWGGTTRTEAE